MVIAQHFFWEMQPTLLSNQSVNQAVSESVTND